MLGNSHDVITATRQHLQPQIDLKTQSFSQAQRFLTDNITGAAMADLVWRSSTDPHAEKKWELPKVAIEVAATIVDRAARTASSREYTEADVREFCAGPQLRKIAAETKEEILAHLARRARGW
jgi:hypothetical protein